MHRTSGAANEYNLDTDVHSMDGATFTKFRKLVREQTGISLRDGKQVMLASRLHRRLRAHHLASFSEYYDLLTGGSGGSEEMREFINCVTTNKTSFFREAHHFDFLRQTLLPQACARATRGSERSLRIWCAASSTGEEPYSIATTLLSGMPAGWRLLVEASDIDTSVLETAQAATYPSAALDGVDAQFCRAHFLRGTGGMSGLVRVKPEVRQVVSFQRINLLDATWPIQEKVDAIFFRNALIYFERELQEKCLRRMVRLLRPEGYLFLGHSEHVPWLYDVVRPLANTVFQVRSRDGQASRA